MASTQPIQSEYDQKTQIEQVTALNRELEKSRNQIENALEENERAYERLKEQYALTDALANIYIAKYLHDVTTNHFRELSTPKDMREIAHSEGDSTEAFKRYITAAVSPDWRPAMFEFCDTSTLVERMKNKQNISLVYESVARAWLRANWVAVSRDKNGNLLKSLLVIEDVNAEKHKEQEDEKMLRRHLSIISSLSKFYVCLYYVDFKTKKYIELDPTSVSDISKVVGKEGNAKEGFDAMVKYLVAPEFKDATVAFTDLFTLDERLKNKNSVSFQFVGQHIGWCVASIVVVDRNADGAPAHVLFTVRSIQDIKEKDESHRLELESKIREITALNDRLRQEQKEKEKERKIIDALSDAYHTVYVVNRKIRSVEVVKMNGFIPTGMEKDKVGPYPFDEVLGLYFSDRMIKEDVESVKSAMDWEHIRSNDGVSKSWYFTYRVKEGKGIHHVQCIFHDISEDLVVCGFQFIDDMVAKERQRNEELEKAKEAAEAANNAKTAFLFNMSHDIRTPMNAIMGFRDLLEKHQDDPVKREDYLRKIQDSSSVLLSIINNVLEMARIEKGTLEVDETAWSVEQFNESLYSVFHEMMEQKGLTFTWAVNVQNNYVFCDPIKMREIFINILSNAYKYTNAGGTVHMQVDELPSKRTGWAVYRTTITDTGIGMSEEFLPHVFEEFSRENNTTDAKVEGTGLGMPIVKRLVELLDGTIEVRSKKGEGSSFIITMPHRIAEKSDLVDHAGVEIDPKFFKGKHILLAEDNDLNAEIAMEILGELGFIIDRAEDGAICVEKLKRSKEGYYDVILMDIQMPNMNGYEATKAIRALGDANKAKTKILAMTANAFEEDRREAMRVGMNGHLAKPIDIRELMKTLANLLCE